MLLKTTETRVASWGPEVTGVVELADLFFLCYFMPCFPGWVGERDQLVQAKAHNPVVWCGYGTCINQVILLDFLGTGALELWDHVTQVGLNFKALLLLSPQCWDYRHVPASMVRLLISGTPLGGSARSASLSGRFLTHLAPYLPSFTALPIKDRGNILGLVTENGGRCWMKADIACGSLEFIKHVNSVA